MPCAYEPFGEFTGGASACTIPTHYRFAGMEFSGSRTYDHVPQGLCGARWEVPLRLLKPNILGIKTLGSSLRSEFSARSKQCLSKVKEMRFLGSCSSH